VILTTCAVVTTIWVLARAGFSLSGLLHHAAAASPVGSAVLGPGLLYGGSTVSKLNFISLALALVLGTAGLPHVLMRLYTVPNAGEARRSVVWTVWLVGLFYLCTLVLGFGAMWLVGANQILSAPGKANSAVPLLAFNLGGAPLLGIVAAVAFATILAVVAGLTLASSSSVAHDVYANVIRKGKASERQEVVVARGSALVIGAIAICLGILARDLNVAFLVALAFAVAASGNLPAILYSLFWKRFNTVGATSAIYGGLIAAVVLVVFSPTVSGATSPIFPHQDFHFFPLTNPGIISIPFGFLCGWLGTMLSSEKNPAKYAELEVRSLTGVGAAN
jgi:cation/acetate symporter